MPPNVIMLRIHQGSKGRGFRIGQRLVHDHDVGVFGLQGGDGVGENTATDGVGPAVKDVAKIVDRCAWGEWGISSGTFG